MLTQHIDGTVECDGTHKVVGSVADTKEVVHESVSYLFPHYTDGKLRPKISYDLSPLQSEMGHKPMTF